MIGKLIDDEEQKQPENGERSAPVTSESKAPPGVLDLPEADTRDDVLQLPSSGLFSAAPQPPAPPEFKPSAPEIKPSAPDSKPPAPPALFSDMQNSYRPDSTAEVIRQSGLAWSAAIVLFGSVVFLMIIGWIFDLIFGSAPWGVVGGIVIGGAIGFVQFFRITSQIFRPPAGQSTSLLGNEPPKDNKNTTFNP